VHQLHAPQFDDAVAIFGGQTCGFRIKNDLTHIEKRQGN
jgi:hypothetical protein